MPLRSRPGLPFCQTWLPSQDCWQDGFLQGLKVAVVAANMYFRTMRNHGVFIPAADRQVVVQAGEKMLDTSHKFDFSLNSH